MITYMCDVICVTNRKLCEKDFLVQIENVAKAYPKAIILREKDLTEQEYCILAEKVMKICDRYGVLCILHNFVNVAVSLESTAIHFPLFIFKEISEKNSEILKDKFKVIGVSCHSVEEAKLAEKLGCTYITAGHIFETDCKKGLAGRGTEFLKEVCESVSIPVYAIGGINKDNFREIKNAGAKGGCIMSGFMKCNDAEEFIENMRRKIV